VKQKVRPYFPGTPAAEATSADGTQRFEPGDRIIGMTDPVNETQVTPVNDFVEYHRRMVLLARKPITFKVQRKDSGETAEIIVKPTFRHNIGVRMRMGEVVALRKGGPAEQAGVVARAEGEQPRVGDRIKAVKLPLENGKQRWYVAGPVDWSKPEFNVPEPQRKDIDVQPLDPLLLPLQLKEWAGDRTTKLPLELVVVHEKNPTAEPKRITLDYDPSFRFDRESANLPNSPLPISGLGLAYWVDGVVDDVAPGGPAANAKTTPGELSTGFWSRTKRTLGMEGRDVAPGGEPMPLQAGDTITAVRFKAIDESGNLQVGPWKDDLKPTQWAHVDSLFQMQSSELDVRVTRDKGVVTVTIKGTPDTEWGLEDRGLILMPEKEIQKAADVGDAVRLGGLRTVRFIKTVYMSLYGYINGRISVKTLSGPLTIANVSYRLAGEDFWQFLLFLGMISVNLAVVNFLPIPVLDGGHMVFLILEKILGRPVPERLFAIFMYAGLFLIISLMLFVLFRDVDRLFFGAS
jgi:regulator of sigma E protease